MVENENKDEKHSSLPRKGSAMYNIIHPDEKIKKKSLKKWKFANKYFIIPFYRIGLLPLIGFGRLFLLLFTIGRLSGKKRVTPLEYHRIDGVIHIFSSRGKKADWFRNLSANPHKVSVRHGFHWFKPEIEAIEDVDEKVKVMKWYIENHPKPAKSLMGYDPKLDDSDSAEFREFTKLIEIVRLHNPSK